MSLPLITVGRICTIILVMALITIFKITLQRLIGLKQLGLSRLIIIKAYKCVVNVINKAIMINNFKNKISDITTNDIQ